MNLSVFSDFSIITQTVDRLHQKTGSQNVVELHGYIHQARCEQDNTIYIGWEKDKNFPPTCSLCGSRLRADIVWFGENLPEKALKHSVVLSQNVQVFVVIVLQPCGARRIITNSYFKLKGLSG